MRIAETGRRFRLSEQDLRFVTETLAGEGAGTEAVLSLLADRETADALLDHPRLLERALHDGGSLLFSEFLYFYLLVRRVFRDRKIDDPEIADYVAGALADYSRDFRRSTGTRSALPFVVDLAEELENAAGVYDRFFLSVRTGNLLIVATGLFHDHLRAREERRGAPGLRYYEDFGAGLFREAGNHPLAREFLLEDPLRRIGESFSSTRRALNRLSDQFLLWN